MHSHVMWHQSGSPGDRSFGVPSCHPTRPRLQDPIMATNPDHHPTSTRPWHDDWTTAAHDQRPLAGSMGAALGQMTGQIQARLAEVERRHAEALRDMQVKLERMSGEAGNVT